MSKRHFNYALIYCPMYRFLRTAVRDKAINDSDRHQLWKIHNWCLCRVYKEVPEFFLKIGYDRDKMHFNPLENKWLITLLKLWSFYSLLQKCTDLSELVHISHIICTDVITSSIYELCLLALTFIYPYDKRFNNFM